MNWFLCLVPSKGKMDTDWKCNPRFREERERESGKHCMIKTERSKGDQRREKEGEKGRKELLSKERGSIEP